MRICFATNNANKLKEVQRMLNDSIELVSLQDIGCTEELKETQATLEGNSRQKAEYVYANYGIPVFADDTGLEVVALNNEPGVKSARYAGDQRDNSANIQLLLSKLVDVENRTARFRTVITLITDQEQQQFEGIVEGEIGTNLKGKDGFGYDPVFVPEGYDRTFAEMSMEEKNSISHRGQAVAALVEHLNKHYHG